MILDITFLWSLGMCTLNGIIYVAAGYDGVSVLQSCERYDPLTGNYLPLLSPTGSRLNPTSYYISNQIIFRKVFGVAVLLYHREEGIANWQLWTTVFGLWEASMLVQR